MPHSQSFNALVLKTYDVGEADRLCVLFTHEQGRLMARASGARRLQSRLGGALLPFQHLTVELKEGNAGWIVCGVSRLGQQETAPQSIAAFTSLEEGVELLLRLVQHEGALPDVFDATLRFFTAARGDHSTTLSYTFCLLHLLGLLPGEEEIQELRKLTPVEQGFVRSCRAAHLASPDPACDLSRLAMLRSLLLEEQISAPLKAANVVAAMM